MLALKEKLGTPDEQLVRATSTPSCSAAVTALLAGPRLHAQHTCPCAFQEMANCQAVILSVEDDTGHRIIIEDLLEATRSPEVGMRQAAAVILNIYCSRSKADYTSHLRSLVSGLIRLFNDSSPVVLEESWDALNAITKVRGPLTPELSCGYRIF